ncbi:hypothetical protein Y032_0191g1288 [Ancylostoma ceylanicum]|uniref:C3HC-type domain-containing protein n=1 Tax=Ancylostoma ceylanicum TaxID=53326 RepID=A0A016SPX0_9BILA|nr:hypothetical protein Y032_0191g1288 [Ancylostoma ceylanicum]
MSAEASVSSTTAEIPLEKIREMKRKACEKLSSLIQAISSNSSPKRSKASVDSFFTYKQLVKSYKFELCAGNELSPRELAVHGWECKARDQVQCIACKQYLCTSLPKITSVDISVYNKCLKRIRHNIINSHVLTCIYRSQPLEFKHDVDEHFLNEIVRPRVSTYNAEGIKLSMIIPDELTSETAQTKCLQSRQPFIGASLGWSIETEKLGGQKQYVAVCDYCARSFTLGYAAFDPVKTHQRWCPVLDVNPDDGIPVWKLIYNQVSPVRKQRTAPATTRDVECAKRALDRSLSVVSREIPGDS